MRVQAVLVVALLLLVSSAGCFSPHRVQVAASALENSPLDWNVTKLAGGGAIGSKSVETRYVHDVEGGPPFDGVLQVFSVRDTGLRSRAALLELAVEVVDSSMQDQGIAVDGTKDASGERRLANGIKTSWLMHEGRIESAGSSPLLDETGIGVRVLAEVAYDGKDKTGVIAIAYVQVSRDAQIPLASDVRDEQTWIDVVGDPSGSIGGATLPKSRGLLYHLRTHA